jgi:hypothetical protein
MAPESFLMLSMIGAVRERIPWLSGHAALILARVVST